MAKGCIRWTAFALGLVSIFVLAAPAAAAPKYEGLIDFPDITSPAGPEDFSWEVDLFEGKELESIDDQHAEVYYAGGHPAYGIEAVPAHAADGANVPTTLAVSEGKIITLTVHHRAGNPAAGGAPFDYPILQGQGWEGGIISTEVKGPKDEAELREDKEREESERRVHLLPVPQESHRTVAPHPADPPLGQKAGRQFAGEAMRQFFKQRWTLAPHRSWRYTSRRGQRLRYAYRYEGASCGHGHVVVWRLPAHPRRGWYSISGDTVCT